MARGGAQAFWSEWTEAAESLQTGTCSLITKFSSNTWLVQCYIYSHFMAESQPTKPRKAHINYIVAWCSLCPVRVGSVQINLSKTLLLLHLLYGLETLPCSAPWKAHFSEHFMVWRPFCSTHIISKMLIPQLMWPIITCLSLWAFKNFWREFFASQPTIPKTWREIWPPNAFADLRSLLNN